MLMINFLNLIAPTAILEIRSYNTDETIKVCKASDLSKDDMNLLIFSIHATSYYNVDHKAYLGMFILCVGEY